MLESIITSKTRLLLLLKFFVNPKTSAYLQELASEFGVSSNGIRIELNRLEKAEILTSRKEGRTILYSANVAHSFYSDMTKVVQKFVGLDYIVEKILAKIGQLESAWIVGDLAKGVDYGIIDLVLIGELNHAEVERLTMKAEQILYRKVRVLILAKGEEEIYRDSLKLDDALLIWGEPA